MKKIKEKIISKSGKKPGKTWIKTKHLNVMIK